LGFDDLAPCDEISINDCEILQYKQWEYPQIVYHPPLLEKNTFREGAEEEKALRGTMGPINSLLQLKINETTLKNVLSKPPDVESATILKAHKTLKLY